MNPYTDKLYYGIDLHARKMYLCILDQKGDVRPAGASIQKPTAMNWKMSPKPYVSEEFYPNAPDSSEPFQDGLWKGPNIRYYPDKPNEAILPGF